MSADNGDSTNSFDDNALGIESSTTNRTTTGYLYTPEGRLLAERVNGSTYYYLLGNLGSVLGVTDSGLSRTPPARARATTNPGRLARPAGVPAARSGQGVSVLILASVTNGGHHGPFFVIVFVVGSVIVTRFRRR